MYAGLPIVGHALWAEVGDGIIFVAFWEFMEFLQNALYGKYDGVICHGWFTGIRFCVLPFVLVFVRLPSLHGYHASVVNWDKSVPRGNCRLNLLKTFVPG